METVGILLILFSILAILVGLVRLLIRRIRKKSRTRTKCLLLVWLAVFVIGAVMSFAGSDSSNDSASVETSVETSVELAEETSVEPSAETSVGPSAEASEETSAEASVTPSEQEQAVSQDAESSVTGTIQVTMLDVHQGLSILVNVDGHYMLYDGGGRSRSSYVVAYLKSHSVTELDYMFVSHYDEDHIAGLVGVLNTAQVDTVVCPEYTTDTKIYQSFVDAKAENGAATVYPKRGDTFDLNGCTITVLAPVSYGDSDNDNSVAVRLVYGGFSCIITGDAEETSEQQMISSGLTLDSDLYVAGHHGSSSSSGAAFLKAVSPAYTFISCGADNSYGHPTEETLERLKTVGSQIFRSDKQGEVTAIYDGTQLTFSTDPCTDWTPGTSADSDLDQTESYQTASSETVQQDSSASSTGEKTYILNTNTKKFHYPDCGSVRQMKDKNKKEVTATREELISEGYDPCQNCNP